MTDATGDTAEGTLTVEVHDDGPVAVADDVTLTEVQAQAGGSGNNVLANDVFGADAPADKTVTSIEGGTLGQPVNGTYGTLTLNENGTYTYTLNAGVDVPKGSTYTEEFTYTITDKDGDASEATLTINITGDESVPVVTVVTPGAGEANIMVDEGALAGGTGQHTEHGVSGSSSFTVQLNGEDGVITVGGESGWKVTVTGDSANVTGNMVTVNGVAVTVTSASQAADGSWTVNYIYELGGGQQHETPATGNYHADKLTGSIAISVTDATGDTAEGTLTVEVHDDGPTITASDMSTSVVPGSGAGNLKNGEAADFTKGTGGESLGHSTNLAGWNGVTMYAAKVTYSGSGNDVQISDIDDNGNYTLKYSPYKGNPKFTSSDWGLTVDAGNYNEYGQYDPTANHNEEISVIKDEYGNANQSEAVVFDLGGQLAYGVTINFGAFYNGKPGAEGTTQWDHVSEKALVTFYRDGQIVGSRLVQGQSSTGTFTLNASDVVLGGFDQVVISAVDNRTPQFQDEHSDFTIQGIDFITKRDDPIIVSEGTVTAQSGADGFADPYAGSHVQFDLAGMVNEDSLSEDGTSGTVTVLVDGIEQTVKLELSEGSSGESILTGTMASGEQLFTATLDENGSWTMEQYEQFRVPGEEGQSSNQFELVFKTEDADGDIAGATVNVPLEVVDQTPGSDSTIGNEGDSIVIDGGDGVAGTVTAGDTGGVTAAFESDFRPDALVAVGHDTITAEDSSSSVIAYGDVMNTDRLLYELNQIPTMNAAPVAAGIGYGSGTEVFQWLENPDNADLLAGTKYEGWTHTDTVDYMLEHAEELGYETLVSDDGMFYLADVHGDVWNMDGSEAKGVELEGLTGRDDGNDTITGSSADDVIFGQEGNDTIHGGAGDDVIYGGSGNDTIHGGAGNDYIDGGAGNDMLYGGAGNDIIVYDAHDVLVDGGEGIDFMVSADKGLTLDTLLAGGENKPLVQNVEVLITGEAALSLTSMEQLANDYGISINVDAGGNETLTLDMTKWTEHSDGTYDFNGEADLTLQLDSEALHLQHDGTNADDAAAQQQVFLLQNSNG